MASVCVVRELRQMPEPFVSQNWIGQTTDLFGIRIALAKRLADIASGVGFDHLAGGLVAVLDGGALHEVGRGAE